MGSMSRPNKGTSKYKAMGSEDSNFQPSSAPPPWSWRTACHQNPLLLKNRPTHKLIGATSTHERLRARGHITLPALSLGGKDGAGPSSSFQMDVWGTDRWSIWVQDGCKVYMDSDVASNGSWLVATWIFFEHHLLEVGLTRNRGGPGTPNAHNCWFIPFLSCVRTRGNRNSFEIACGWGHGQKKKKKNSGLHRRPKWNKVYVRRTS